MLEVSARAVCSVRALPETSHYALTVVQMVYALLFKQFKPFRLTGFTFKGVASFYPAIMCLQESTC